MNHFKVRSLSIPSNHTIIIGVVNVTPDSFSDGGEFLSVENAVAHAKQLVADGADILDIGGESSRPGAVVVSEEEELRRVIPVIERLRREVDVPISLDTYKPRVAEDGLKHGVDIINDITGLRNPQMIEVVAKYKCPVIIMHMQGEPKTMQKEPQYQDVITDIKDFFGERIAAAQKAGVKNIILDPGIGFGKKLNHNLEILRRFEEFCTLGYPVLIGTSRKSFLGMLMNGAGPKERLEGTLATTIVAVLKGAQLVRVHDVKEMKKALIVVDAVRNQR